MKHNEPKFVPQEELYLKVFGVTWVDETHKLNGDNGQLIVTTHRVLWTDGNYGVEVPLCYIFKVDKSGGIFSSKKITI